MGVKAYLYGLFFLSLAFLTTLGLIILTVNPYDTTVVNIILFFLSLLGFLTATLALFCFYLRVHFSRKIETKKFLQSALSSAFFIACFLVGILVFLALNIANLWTIGLYFAILVLIGLILKAR
jgi:hypothetical protein